VANSAPTSSPIRIDDLDRAILDALERDARSSARAIGREVGVAAGTVGQRIARLEQLGVIRGYTARIDRAVLGRPLRVVVGLQMSQGKDMPQALQELAALPEVEEVLVVTGRWDVLVLARVADPHELNRVLTQELWRSPSFRHSETMIVIDERTPGRQTD
jgi:Lrp/AsnC family transcriptional regulator, leucine-responsive regulatory protein